MKILNGLMKQRLRKIEATIERLQQPLPIRVMAAERSRLIVELGEIQSNLTKEQFIANVDQAKEYIRAGDIFQVVLPSDSTSRRMLIRFMYIVYCGR